MFLCAATAEPVAAQRFASSPAAMAQTYGALSGGYSSPHSDESRAASRSPSPTSGSLNGGGDGAAATASDRLLQSSRLSGSSSLWRSSRSLLPAHSAGGRAPLRKTRSIVVLGFSAVGKTALCVRFVNDRFEEAYEPTYENSFVKLVQHRGQEIECLIKDTQGVGEQEVFRNEYGLGVHGYVLVYSISSARSFAIVQTINHKLINLMGTKAVPRVLIGNKFDLAASPSSASAAAAASGAAAAQAPLVRQVSVEQGQALADQWGCPFFECSAKLGTNIDRAFSTLLDEIDAINEPQHPRDMDRWWRSLFCCKWWRRRWGSSGSSSGSGDEEDGAIDGGHRESLLSSSDLALAVERHTNVCKVSVWAVTMLAVTGVVYGASLAIHSGPTSDDDSESHLVGYVLAGLALLVWLVSLVGLFALRSTSSAAEFLTVYMCALVILVVAEAAVWLVLLLNVALVAAHVVAAALVGAVTVALQLASCTSAYKLAKALGATAASTSPYGDDYRATYHSLYE